MAISHDGQTLYSAALDGKVIVWDLAGARRLGRPFTIGPDYRYAFQPYAMRPDGRVLAVGHPDGTVTLIDARTLRALSTFRAVPRGPVLSMGYPPRSRLLVIGGDYGYLAFVDPAARGKLVTRLPGHSGPLLTMGFSSDGRHMATGSREAIILWTLRSGEATARPARSSVEVLGDVALSPDGRMLAIVHPDQGVEVIDATTLRRRAQLTQSETVGRVRFTPDGRYIVGGSENGWARLWSTKTWRPATHVLAGSSGAVSDCP